MAADLVTSRAPGSASDVSLTVEREPTAIHVIGVVDGSTARDFDDALAVCDRDPLVASLDLSLVSRFTTDGVRCFVRLGWPDRPHPRIVASPSVRRALAFGGYEFLLASHGWREAFDGWFAARLLPPSPPRSTACSPSSRRSAPGVRGDVGGTTVIEGR